MTHATSPKQTKISLHIDRQHVFADKTPMTGAELKHLGGVNSTYDLFLVQPGPGDDQLIGDGDLTPLKDGMHFVSAPRDLNPGG